MPKLVTIKQQEGQDAKATAYVKAYMLFPAGILGLVSMVGGVGGLGYQLIATDTYTWETFVQSSGLLMLGGLLGWLQTTYHRWILRHRPGVFAARMRQPTLKKSGRPKRDGGSDQDSPAGRPGLLSPIWPGWQCFCLDPRSVWSMAQSIRSPPISCPGPDFFGRSCSFGEQSSRVEEQNQGGLFATGRAGLGGRPADLFKRAEPFSSSRTRWRSSGSCGITACALRNVACGMTGAPDTTWLGSRLLVTPDLAAIIT